MTNKELLQSAKDEAAREWGYVRKFMLQKFPTDQYLDCPVPNHYWDTIQEYADNYHSEMLKNIPSNILLVDAVFFTAKSLDGQQIEMSFSEISAKYPDDDVFYYNNGIGEPIACFLSSLSVVVNMEAYASQQRTEGIREGFEAARSLDSPTDIKNTEHGVEVFEPFKYLTADDYLNRKQ